MALVSNYNSRPLAIPPPDICPVALRRRELHSDTWGVCHLAMDEATITGFADGRRIWRAKRRPGVGMLVRCIVWKVCRNSYLKMRNLTIPYDPARLPSLRGLLPSLWRQRGSPMGTNWARDFDHCLAEAFQAYSTVSSLSGFLLEATASLPVTSPLREFHSRANVACAHCCGCLRSRILKSFSRACG